MPEITVIHIAIIAGALIVGMVLGWVTRGSRSAAEKAAISGSWQEQLEAQRKEHERLLEQNKSLMDQNSQYQASNKDAKMRASELSGALKEAFARRDELQRQIKDIRGNLEVAIVERDQLRVDVSTRLTKDDSAGTRLREKDAKIEKLNVELQNWQDRLPPLIERFRQRNAEAEQLEQDLAAARVKITALEEMVGSEQTRVEPVDPDSLTDGMDASNDPSDAESDEDSAEDELEELLSIDELEDAEDAAGEDEPDAANLADEVQAQFDDDGTSCDDLKQIKGVGPAIEKTLNELGIRRYHQIAEMSEYDIDRVAHRLKGFRSRIYREDWIGQARELCDQKANGQH
jgi:predicted flap endonuclease-1-like 5' DNA nuclease